MGPPPWSEAKIGRKRRTVATLGQTGLRGDASTVSSQRLPPARTGGPLHQTSTSPEFALLAACCRWPATEERATAVRRAAADLDWPRFRAIASRHRVTALVHDGLRQAAVNPPPEEAQAFAEAATEAGRAGLGLARETIRVQKVMEAAGLTAVFIKGATLALLAYGDLGVKQSWDIDLLTTPSDAPATLSLLRGMGYDLAEFPPLNDAQFRDLVALEKECLLVNRKLGLAIDLHWRLVDNPLLLDGIESPYPLQTVLLGGVATPTLADDALFAHLCTHGALHGWSRLKWLADLAAFLAPRSPAEIERLYDRAVALGAGRAPGLAILLCEHLFAIAPPPALLGRLRADRRLARLAAVCLDCLHSEKAMADLPALGSLLRLRLLVALFSVGTAPGYGWAEMRCKLTSYQDRLDLPLPPALRFLYAPLRAPLWVWRSLRRGQTKQTISV